MKNYQAENEAFVYTCDVCGGRSDGAGMFVGGDGFNRTVCSACVDREDMDTDPRNRARELLAQYDALVADHAQMVEDEARDKYIDERRMSIEEMVYELAEVLREVTR